MILAFKVPGPCVAKARARRGKGGIWYTPTRTRKYERLVADCAALQTAHDRQQLKWRTDGRYRVTAHVKLKTRGRADSDNFLKGILDGITKARCVWDDDKQAVDVRAHVEWPCLEVATLVTVEVVR